MIDRVGAGLFSYSYRVRNQPGHHPGITHWRQRDEPDAVVKPVGDLGRKLYRQPGLANARRTDKRDQTLLYDNRPQGPNFRPAINEGRQLERNVKAAMS